MSIKLKILNISLLLSGCVLSMQSFAACTPNTGFRTQDVSMSVGRVVVRPSDAVGTILRKATFPISSNGSTFYCDWGSLGTIEAVLLQNYPLSPSGNSIYSTNIEGIGIRLYREADTNANFSGYYPYRRTLERNKNYSLSTGYFVVEIIKTAPNTGSGALVEGKYSSYHVTGYASRPLLTSTVYGNAITIASSSCELQGDINKIVKLPTVNKADFNGVGSTHGEQAFDLNILCNGGKNPTGYEERNKISLAFDYQVANNLANVIRNDAPAATRASGVGVQLLSKYKNSTKAIAKNEKVELGTVQSNQTLQYSVPMLARYYQTATNVTPGAVRSVATVTIEYE